MGVAGLVPRRGRGDADRGVLRQVRGEAEHDLLGQHRVLVQQQHGLRLGGQGRQPGVERAAEPGVAAGTQHLDTVVAERAVGGPGRRRRSFGRSAVGSLPRSPLPRIRRRVVDDDDVLARLQGRRDDRRQALVGVVGGDDGGDPHDVRSGRLAPSG